MKSKSILAITGIIVFSFLACNNQNIEDDQGSSNNQASSEVYTSNTENMDIKTTIDSVSYALGVAMGRSFAGFRQQGLKTLNMKLMIKALQDSHDEKELSMTFEEADAFLQKFFKDLQKNAGAKNIEEGKAFLAENKNKEGVITTASGLQYKVLKEGSGTSPTIDDKVTAHYHGTLLDGTVFDSSVDRGEPLSIDLKNVIPGWQEALTMMKPGSKWILWIPGDLAYGDQQQGPGGANATLIFEVELISVDK